jgi:hypothetical protein
MAMVEDADVRNYRPTFVIDQHGVMKYADVGSNPVAPLVLSSLVSSQLNFPTGE